MIISKEITEMFKEPCSRSFLDSACINGYKYEKLKLTRHIMCL